MNIVFRSIANTMITAGLSKVLEISHPKALAAYSLGYPVGMLIYQYSQGNQLFNIIINFAASHFIGNIIMALAYDAEIDLKDRVKLELGTMAVRTIAGLDFLSLIGNDLYNTARCISEKAQGFSVEKPQNLTELNYIRSLV